MGEGRAGSGGGGTLSGIQVFTGAIAYGCSVTNKIRPPPPSHMSRRRHSSSRTSSRQVGTVIPPEWDPPSPSPTKTTQTRAGMSGAFKLYKGHT